MILCAAASPWLSGRPLEHVCCPWNRGRMGRQCSCPWCAEQTRGNHGGSITGATRERGSHSTTMFPTLARLSKASRRPLTPKRGNKDFYKGTRQAFLPGGHRTGAPGKHVVGGKAKYRLLDEQVRVFVAPAIEDIRSSPLRPYVNIAVKLTDGQKKEVYSSLLSNSSPATPSHT